MFCLYQFYHEFPNNNRYSWEKVDNCATYISLDKERAQISNEGEDTMSDDVSAWADLLRGVGFPIVITAYLLLRFEKK